MTAAPPDAAPAYAPAAPPAYAPAAPPADAPAAPPADAPAAPPADAPAAPPADAPADELRLTTLALATPWFRAALAAVRELKLGPWCIGAGAVRNLVWDHLHDPHKLPSPSCLGDVDVAHFDPLDLSAGHDAAIERELRARLPGLRWEVTNQAGVHCWFERCFGHAVEPLRSLEDAVASWPEFATAVGISMRPDGSLQVIAPHGLGDLFGMRVRRNPARVSVATYRLRVAQKRYAERWPRVTVEPA